MAKRIEIIEVGPRDGLQNQSAILSTEDKVAMIEKLIDAGARRLEVASFVNPARVPQMADAEGVIAGLPDRKDVTYIGLVLNARGVERALQTKIDEVGAVAIATDSFGLRNQKQTWRESVEVSVDIIERAKKAGVRAQATISVAFGCPFEGEVPLARVVEMARAIAKAGPHEIAVADTVGVGVPSQVKEMIAALREAIPGMPLRCHFHNTRNTGLANAFAAAEMGVDRLDASVGGIGGCPFAPSATGNIGTEDLIYMLHRSGFETGYDLAKLNAMAPWLAGRLNLSGLPAMVSRTDPFPQVLRQ
ncbi:MAG TPA: hydroxymethylglutaryl-CoA lyase [Rhizomicrobium sp.]|jgi:hydroxymethylglutaryl-CoA lyase|nr:hydroxymethylglutaryl-CoA lyase [Rhizomicrobium sp.]